MLQSTFAAWTPTFAHARGRRRGRRQGACALYQSIYETALRNQVPRTTIDDLIRIYSYDIDFQRKVQPGDSFELLYAGERKKQPAPRPKSSTASLTTGGEIPQVLSLPVDRRRGWSTTTTDTGKEAPRNSSSARPLAEGTHGLPVRIAQSSRPALYTHAPPAWTGASPMGTPIYASGKWHDRKGRLGRRIRQNISEISHANGYATGYGHMSGLCAQYRRRQEKCARAKSSAMWARPALSTGAHLHYEILDQWPFRRPDENQNYRAVVSSKASCRRRLNRSVRGSTA